MKKILLLCSLTALMGLVFADLAANEAEAQVYRRRRCRALRDRVIRWEEIRNRNIRRWNRCSANLGWSHPRCRNLRASINAWQANVNAARSDYARWGCRFAWNQWNDPWAPAPAPAPVNQSAQCQALAARVVRWRNIRNSYHIQYNNCSRNWGWSHPRCRGLRRTLRGWQARVRAARVNYNQWGCRFAWENWNDNW
jgi:hypothetical protein